ncbi:MAG TPA: UvrD-helicase domain-containing protein [Longimicrobiales bacterium]|nr:UvrD-helicase domain-containing protein [Longimicrobiales bacterium]
MRRRSDDRDQLPLFDAGPPPATPPPSPGLVDAPLPDEAARARIREDLGTNLLVEAGAGSGKTTALVDRMVALVLSDTAPVDRIAAVTFTRKAAAELQQRFQARLEDAIRDARHAGASEEAARLDRALRDIHRAFIGTIHSFCARLLRERPVEAGLDPGFEELLGVEETRMRRAFWHAHLERLAGADHPLLAELADIGLAPSRLQGLFDALVANPDVDFPSEPVAAPAADEVAAVRGRLDALIDRGLAMLPAEPDPRGWDELQSRIRLLAFLRRVVRWSDRADFLDILGEEVVGRSYRVVQKRWPDGAAAKALGEEWGDLRDGGAAAVVDRWWAHRYPIAVRFAREAAEAFEAERIRGGRLNFQDLLMRAARLLREHDAARDELGERYRRLLVDEFQDTDPVQAEVLTLLAAPPDGRRWQDATPRPGALFVVGDPKQSIYRFRRADIAVYNLVRERFQDFGDVLGLVANFRSLPPFGALVQDVFARPDRFAGRATRHQAAFAPLRTRRAADPARQRIGQYYIDPEGRSHVAVAADDAARLAPWIAGEIAAGRRRPEDFLILARQKAGLATYARALEGWRVPVQVTGAGVEQAEELTELLVLLEALADPTDPVKVVAALAGLFFGLDLDALLAWSRGEDLPAGEAAPGRWFDMTRPHAGDPTPVGRALATLHRWWSESRTTPADVLVGRVMDEVGLVPLAASRDLGELRAGSLLFALDSLRVAALHGDTSIPAAVDALRAALESDEAEAPLEPIRRGAARVMTLHQAKGLEAPVVILAHPVGQREHDITSHIERREDGSAVGHLVVQERAGFHRVRTLARPKGWEEKEEEERRYERAEEERLLYVAATRARDSLLVSRKARDEARSPWRGLYDWMDGNGELVQLEPAPTPEREQVERSARELTDDAALLADRRRRAASPRYVVRSVTALARAATAEPSGEDLSSREADGGRPADPGDGPDPAFRGLSWGSAVHGALDAGARGASGDALRAVCRSLLLETGRPDERGEPVELEELTRLVERVLGSAIWARARAAERVLTEVPFAFHAPAGRLPDPDAAAAANAPRLLEGVVDLAFLEADGWVLVDYKTDVGTDAGFDGRRRRYRRQVDLYALVWPDLAGGRVKERVLFYTARAAPADLERW